MNRFAKIGETADPCGVPLSRSTMVPSGYCSGARSHRLTYSSTHRSVVTAPTACSCDLFGRYPYESGWNLGSTNGSRNSAATVWATRSPIVGTPSVRTPPPCGLGISTARTGGGKYVPELIRFQILYSSFFRSASNSARDFSSTPGAPLFSATFWYASHTMDLGISNDLTCDFGMSPRLLPEPDVPVARTNTPGKPAPWLRPHTQTAETS